jgi:hypothetical protein
MRAESWGGLITNASPFSLPPGAAVEQVNLPTNIPGQLTSRDGMRRVGVTEGATPVAAADAPRARSIIAFARSGGTVLLIQDASGLAFFTAPTPETAATPTEPSLSASSGQVATSYTGRFLRDGIYNDGIA